MHWIWSVVSVLSLHVVCTRVSGAGKAIYLSFDDGPDPVHTPQLLDLMKRYGAKATFFLIGDKARRHPDLVQRIVEEGHTVGNHSMTHPRMPKLSARAQLAEIAAADAVLSRFSGRARQPFRPPNGRATLATIADSVLRRRPLVLWSIDSKDYTLDAQQVVRQVERAKPRGGDILLFHDDGAVAGAALGELMPRWRRAGLSFEAL